MRRMPPRAKIQSSANDLTLLKLNMKGAIVETIV